MKTRIVLWGANEADEKLLIALALNAQENSVDMYTFPAAIATEEFYNLMANQWRNGAEVEMPEGFSHTSRPLSMTDGLLPDNIKVERTDVVMRAQTEWHFVVLSSKLYQAYRSEMDEIKERISNSTHFDKKIWEELKSFWEKVQGQINEQNLFRDHGRKLREQSNELFKEMKKFRKQMDDEFKTKSKEFAATFMEKLQKVEEKIESGLSLQPLFNELKNIQKEYRDTPFTRDDRSKIWNRIDKAFKNVKEKKYGPGKGGDQKVTALNRTQKRYEGLLNAIQKMERSIQRDKSDLEFQDRKIAQSEGQLEAQIRQAKVKMIEERIRSKNEKLVDMQKTKLELEQRIEKEKAREVKRAEEQKVREAKEKVKEKIAEEMKEKAQSLDVDPDKLEKAAEEISKNKKGGKAKVTTAFEGIKPADAVTAAAADAVANTEALIEKAAETITEADAVIAEETKASETVETKEPKAEADAATSDTTVEPTTELDDSIPTVEESEKSAENEQSGDAEESIRTESEAGTEDEKKADETPKDEAAEEEESPLEQAEEFIEGIASTLGDAIQDMSDTIKAVATVVGDKIEEALGDEEE